MGTENNLLDLVFPSMVHRSITEDSDSKNNLRLAKACQQYFLSDVDTEKIVTYVLNCLNDLGLNVVVEENDEECYKKYKRTIDFEDKKTVGRQIGYYDLYSAYKEKGMKCKDDIVWIKFTVSGHIGVIGTSCDVTMKALDSDYSSKRTADKITYFLSKEFPQEKEKFEWDKELLVFPLLNIPEHLTRSDIESCLGNYLISKNVPILDFYSHYF